MATATLNIALSNTTGSTGIKVYYKLHSSSTWIYTTTYAPSGTTASISGLSYNLIYDFQIQNVNGSTNPSSNVISQIGFSSPSPVISPTNTTVGVSFSNLSSDITSYTLTIATAASPSTILQTITVSPSGTTITGNFTSLIPATSYVVGIKATAGVYDSPVYTFSTTTLTSAGCPDPTSITATLTL